MAGGSCPPAAHGVLRGIQESQGCRAGDGSRGSWSHSTKEGEGVEVVAASEKAGAEPSFVPGTAVVGSEEEKCCESHSPRMLEGGVFLFHR